MNKKKILEKADALYWAGKETGLTDAEYDSIAGDMGHICQPPKTLKGWALYPDYPLLSPHSGLKKVNYETAQRAVRYWPKWDGIYLQLFLDGNGWHYVTRGDGRIGKDLTPILKNGIDYLPKFFGDYELVYPTKKGGRQGLIKDLSRGYLSLDCSFINHLSVKISGNLPREIPQEIDGLPIDGWVIQLASGEKYKYKG